MFISVIMFIIFVQGSARGWPVERRHPSTEDWEQEGLRRAHEAWGSEEQTGELADQQLEQEEGRVGPGLAGDLGRGQEEAVWEHDE